MRKSKKSYIKKENDIHDQLHYGRDITQKDNISFLKKIPEWRYWTTAENNIDLGPLYILKTGDYHPWVYEDEDEDDYDFIYLFPDVPHPFVFCVTIVYNLKRGTFYLTSYDYYLRSDDTRVCDVPIIEQNDEAVKHVIGPLNILNP